jgi:glucosamine--fructose-6-phosphate aminotransferase (isomerizing)
VLVLETLSECTSGFRPHSSVVRAPRSETLVSSKFGDEPMSRETNSIAASGWSAAGATHGPLGQVAPGTPVIILTTSPGGPESV